MRTLARITALVALAALIGPAADGGARLEAQAPKHNCAFCHDLHGGGFSQLTNIEIVEDLCISCHGDAGPAQVDRDGSLVDVPRQDGIHNGALHVTPTSCWNCHDHEGAADTNLFMIPRTRTDLPQGGSATITFTANQAQADFVGAEGVCYVCHTDVATQNTGFAGHNGPDVCTTCHSHDGGFQGVGGGCTTCHATGRGNHREVVSEFDRSSHHIQLGGAGADIPDADCTTCHDQNGHPRRDTDFVVLVNQTDGSTITYEAGVSATSVLNPFCLGCHDSDGANNLGTPLVPFSDAVTRPEVNEVAWSAASHAAGAACADCHEGHGSQKVSLFKPGDVSPDPTTLYEEEEGFCFQCHTAGGAASTNIDAQFDPSTINWVSDVWGLGGITTFNDRHDVSHQASSVSGAKIECVNCHNPHADNAGQKFDPDPDPSSTPPTWSGQSTLTAFCLDCHDNTFPTGVLPHGGGPMVDIADAYVNNDSHGVPITDGAQHNLTVAIEATLGAGSSNTVEEPNPWLGYQIMGCDQCHRPHPKTAAEWPDVVRYDFFGLQDTVRAPDGRGMAYWEDVSSMGQTTRVFYWDYGLSEDDSQQVTEADAGGWYCNVCHDRRGMNGKNTCGSSGCHRHGGKL